MKVNLHVVSVAAGIRREHDPVDLEPGDSVAYSDDVRDDVFVLSLSRDGETLDITVKVDPGVM